MTNTDNEALASNLVAPMQAIKDALINHGLGDKEAMATIHAIMDQIGDDTWDGDSGCYADALADKWPEMALHMKAWKAHLRAKHGVTL